jgi:hypothetical protein
VKVSVYTHKQAQPHTVLDVTQTATHASMYCVTTREGTQKFPLQHVARVEESNA